MNKIIRLAQNIEGHNLFRIHEAFRCITTHQASDIRKELLQQHADLNPTEGEFIQNLKYIETNTWADGTKCDLYAILWQPGIFRSWHRHPNSVVSIACVDGTLTELFCATDTNKISKHVYENIACTIHDKIGMHCIGNIDVENATSLHIATFGNIF